MSRDFAQHPQTGQVWVFLLFLACVHLPSYQELRVGVFGGRLGLVTAVGHLSLVSTPTSPRSWGRKSQWSRGGEGVAAERTLRNPSIDFDIVALGLVREVGEVLALLQIEVL